MMKTLILGLLLVGLTANASTAADAVREQNPELAQHVASLQPMKNRAGKYYFPDAQLVSPDAQVLVTERLLGGDDEPAVQVALAYALDGKHRLPLDRDLDAVSRRSSGPALRVQEARCNRCG